MAIAKNGINGPFSGKIGPIVGYMWKGRPVMRAMPKKTKKNLPSNNSPTGSGWRLHKNF